MKINWIMAIIKLNLFGITAKIYMTSIRDAQCTHTHTKWRHHSWTLLVRMHLAFFRMNIWTNIADVRQRHIILILCFPLIAWIVYLFGAQQLIFSPHIFKCLAKKRRFITWTKMVNTLFPSRKQKTPKNEYHIHNDHIRFRFLWFFAFTK